MRSRCVTRHALQRGPPHSWGKRESRLAQITKDDLPDEEQDHAEAVADMGDFVDALGADDY